MLTTPFDALVLSGGEPCEQADGLVELIDRLRAERDWFVTLYSGFRRERLEQNSPRGAKALLERADLLIDGPYVAAKHAPLLWRGSANQRIHNLTGRVVLPADRPAGLQLHVDETGVLDLVGVPAAPDDIASFEQLLGADFEELDSAAEAAARTWPFPVLDHEPIN
jgi:anaerobic ribonucleoside-triphosphate reductase activating protein